jgi:3-isopropylmalate/(R)-2-methylmalate dehydratase small subunit
MEAIKVIRSRTAVLPLENVDTDQIIPARFLRATTREGFGQNLFADWRYDASGAPRADFLLNRPEAQGCSILVAGRNFGCGSSREHAPQGLGRFGIRAIVGESFSEIFFGNSVALGMPCVTADRRTLDALMDVVRHDPATALVVDLDRMTVAAGTQSFPITLPKATREAFLDGSWDATGLLLERFDEVERVAAWLPYLQWS